MLLTGKLIKLLSKFLPSKVISYFLSLKKLSIVIGIALLAVLLSPFGPGAPVKVLDPEDVAKHIKNTCCDGDQFIERLRNKIIDAVQNKEGLPEINLAYLSFLSSYVCELPKHNPLVVWGPSSETQSGLRELVDYWQSQKRIVVEIDLDDFNGDLAELNKLIDKAVLYAFAQRKLSRKVLQALDNCITTEKEEMGDLGVKGRIIDIVKIFTKPVISLIAGPLEGFLPANVIDHLYEEQLDHLGEYMGSFFKRKNEALKEINFKDFFRAMRLISRIDTSFAPIVVISNLENVEEEGKIFVKRLIGLLEDFEKHKNNIPIIISSSNTLWLKNAQIDDDEAEKLFHRYEIFALSLEQLVELFVDTLNVWTSEEIKEITEEIGFRSTPFKELYRANILNGISLGVAIDQAQQKVCQELVEAINNYDPDSQALSSFILSLPVKINPSEAISNKQIHYLLSKNVVYLSSYHMLDLVANGNGMKKAIRECLENECKSC